MKNNIKKVLLIENPKAGQGNSNLDQFKLLLLSKGITVTVKILEEGVEILDLVKDIEEFDCLVTAGGDGTVCAASQAIMHRNVPLFVYPAGTANLVAQNLGMSKTPEQLIDILTDGDMMAIDIPLLKSKSKTTGFIVAAGAGADAEMIKESEGMKASLGTLAYVVGALKQISPVEAEFIINIDGKEIKTTGICALMANLGMINFKMPIAEGIDPTDGYINLLIFKGNSLLSLVPNLLDSIKHKFGIGQPQFSENLEIYIGKKISLISNPPLPVQYDGELLVDKTPIEVEVIPQAVKFFYSDPEITT